MLKMFYFTPLKELLSRKKNLKIFAIYFQFQFFEKLVSLPPTLIFLFIDNINVFDIIDIFRTGLKFCLKKKLKTWQTFFFLTHVVFNWVFTALFPNVF